jgi:hypothetical protein
MADSLSDPSATSLNGPLQGAGLESILQTLHMKRETCILKVSTSDKTGLLYLEQGNLVGAITGSLEGEEAAFSILKWKDSKVGKDASGQRLRRPSTDR